MYTTAFKINNSTYDILLNDFYCTGVISETRTFGELLIAFYEMDLSKFVEKINRPIDLGINYAESIENYINECKILLSNDFDVILISLMLNEIENFLLSSETQNIESSVNDLNKIFTSYATIKAGIECFIDGHLSSLNDFVLALQSMEAMEAKYFLSNGQLCLSLHISSIYSLVALEMLNIQSKNIPLKRCENCKQLFIPQVRTDEIYCNRIFRNRKTCKEIGYAEKEKKNPFKNLYTKERKTQHARIRYNSHIPNYKEKHYEPWKKAAEKARDKFQKESDLEGFIDWLNKHRNSF